MEFNSKYNAATDMYLAFRNFLFIQAVSGVAEDCDFIAKIKKIFFLEIRKFNYISADLLLDAVEDFLKGPEFFATVNGENLIKQYSAKAKNEKMLPIEKFRDMTFDINKAYEYIRLNEQDMEIFINTNNGHELPDELLLDDDIIPEISFDDQFESPYKQFLRKKILVINVSAKTIGLREMDKEEYRRIMDRYNEIMQRYEVEKEDVTEKYKDSAKEFKSFDFWQDYLGLDDTKI